MIGRVVFNVVLFAVLLGGIGGFLLQSRGEALVLRDVVVVVALGASWAGLLVAWIETRLYPIDDVGKRCGLAALLGAAAYLGLFSGVAFLAGFGPQPFFLFLGIVMGGVSHALRARLYGGRRAAGPDHE
jgi:hypothetical protein